MINKKLLLLLPVILLVSLWFIVSKSNFNTTSTLKSPGASNSTSLRPAHPNLFFDEQTFNDGVTQTKKANLISAYHISGGIIPHHLFPGFILTDFFNRLSTQNPKTIILIGPNHYEKGDFKVLTSLYSWDTPFGRVEPEDSIINGLVKKNIIKIDEEVLSNEHSVAGMMPFIKYYLPNANVAPLIISNHITEGEAELLAENLINYAGKDTILVAPVDFSHYLTNEQAKEKDKLTLEVIKNYDYRQLFTLNNDYLDSPPSIAVLLMVMQRLGKTEMDILYHANSGELQKDNYIETTSYFSIVYYNQDSSAEVIPMNIDKIFSTDHSWVNNLPAERKQVLIATGDVLLARSINYKTVVSKNFSWPFEKTAEVLKNADVTFINLETPIIDGCQLANEGMKFCGDPGNINGLVFAGVDMVNLANNHISDYGLTGVNSTVEYLINAGLGVSGISGPMYQDIKGKKFAFLGYNEVNRQEGISSAGQERIISEVSEAKSNADIVIVQFHWGNEYTSNITSRQRALAHLAIDRGADLVIGNHPHWIQPVEIYHGKLIAYSHGNFIFDQEWDLNTKQGVVGKYTFYDGWLIDAEYLPILIENYGQPRFLSGEDKVLILENMKAQSEKLLLGYGE